LETLKYSQGRLQLRIAGAGLALAGAAYLFGNPDVADNILLDLTMFGGDIGHYIVLPFTMISSGVVVWLTAMRLMGGCEAVEALPDAIRVTGFWGRTRIAWDDLGHVYIERKRRRWFFRASYLVFHFVGRGLFGSSRVRVLLNTTELPAHRYEAYCASILATKRSAEGRLAGAAPSDTGAAEGGFDADAALARYLARKAAGRTDTPVVPPAQPQMPPLAQRPVFGRKPLERGELTRP